MSRTRLFLILGCLLHLLIGSQFFDLPVWSDEASSVWFSRFSVNDLIFALCDPHPPGYYLSLKAWSALDGSPQFLRLFSLLASMLTVGATYLLGKLVANRWVGLVGALLLAIHPIQAWYAAEIRFYTSVELLCLLTAIAFFRWQAQAHSGSRWLYLLFGTLALWFDYTAVIVLGLIQLAWLALYWRDNTNQSWRNAQSWGRLRDWFTTNLALFAPTLLIWTLIDQFVPLGNTYQPVFIAVRAQQFGLALTPADASQLIRIIALLGAAVCLALALLWPRLSTIKAVPILFGLGLIALWVALTVGGYLPRLYTVKRLLLILLPYLTLAAGYLLAKTRITVIAACVTLCALTLLILPNHSKEPWPSVLDQLSTNGTAATDAIWVDELLVPAFDFNLREAGLETWSYSPLLGQALPSLPEQMPSQDGRLWLVTGDSPYRNLPALLPADFYEQYTLVSQSSDSGLQLLGFQPTDSPEPSPFDQTDDPKTEWGLLLPSPLATCR